MPTSYQKYLTLSFLARSARLLMIGINRVGRRKYFCHLALFLLPLLVQVLFCHRIGLPYPTIHDEFSYLFGADTLLAGRLSNPSPPSLPHFETFHVLVSPTFSSKYPIGQSFVLAAGKLLTGHYFWGVIATIGLALQASFWCLRAWMPPGYSLIGSLVGFFLTVGLAHPWVNSYWGGGLILLGCLLTTGGFSWIFRHRSSYGGFWLAVGCSICFFSRPFEGGILCLSLILYLIVALALNPPGIRYFALNLILPLFLLGSLTLFAQYKINASVTGKAFQLPYMLHSEQYSSMPILWVLQPDGSKKLGGKEIEAGRKWELSFYENLKSQKPLSAFQDQRNKLRQELYLLAISPSLLFVLCLAYPLASLFSFWLLALPLFFGNVLESSILPHYVTPLFVILKLIEFRALANLRFISIRGVKYGTALSLLCILTLYSEKALSSTRILLFGIRTPSQRQLLETYLNGQPGNHLVFVRRQPKFDHHNEMVYNSPTWKESRIVWVRDIDDPSNKKLADQLGGRTLWLCEADLFQAPSNHPVVRKYYPQIAK